MNKCCEVIDRIRYEDTMKLCKEIDLLRKENAELKELLRDVEWGNRYTTSGGCTIWKCPVCEQTNRNGHSDDCRLAKALEVKE